MSPLFGAGLTSPAGVPKATVNATTGSPTVNNNARAGKTIYQFNGSGSLTVGTAGTVELLLVGGGGASMTIGAGGPGGGGGVILDTAAYLNSGTQTVVVGAGFAAPFYVTNGTAFPRGATSSISNYSALGGGVGGGQAYFDSGRSSVFNFNPGYAGGSGGGGYNNGIGGAGTSGQGFAGGKSNSARAGGGGGAGAVGADTNGVGGAGRTTNINGSTVVYGGGGGAGGNGAGGNTAGAAGGAGGGGNGANWTSYNVIAEGNAGGVNTGGGGGGSAQSNNPGNGSSGGSGIVIVVVG